MATMTMTKTHQRWLARRPEAKSKARCQSRRYFWISAVSWQNSEHPLAAAIVRGAKEQSVVLEAVTGFRSVTGGGVAGAIAGRKVTIGEPNFPRGEKITGMESLEASAMKLQEEGKTTSEAEVGTANCRGRDEPEFRLGNRQRIAA
jgi:cation transport ATPase